MNEALRVLIAALLLVQVGLAGGCSEEDVPDDAALRADLAEVRKQIEEAREAAGQHKSGLVGEIAAMRREILLLSAAMLENRLIAKGGGVPAKLVAPALAPNPERAEQILRHIATAEESLEKAKEQAAVQEGVAANLSQTAIMTQELTLAQLRLAYYQSAYGIALPGQQRPALARSAGQTSMAGTTAKADRGSLDTRATSGGSSGSDAAPSPELPPPLSPEEVDALIESARASETPPQEAALPTPQELGSDEYRRIQQLLQKSGHDPGPVDGQWGPRTREALRSFQRIQGLPPSGTPDAATLDALGFN